MNKVPIIGPYVEGYTIIHPPRMDVANYPAFGRLWAILPDIMRVHAYNEVNLRNTPTEKVRSKISSN